MSAFDDWLADHWDEPWQWWGGIDHEGGWYQLGMPEAVSSTRLYKTYVTAMKAADRPVMSQTQWAEALKAVPGIEWEHTEGGTSYLGLMVDSRQALAEEQTARFLIPKDRVRVELTIRQAHADKKHDGDLYEAYVCSHPMPPAALDAIAADEAAMIAEGRADPRFADLLEANYGPYLRSRGPRDRRPWAEICLRDLPKDRAKREADRGEARALRDAILAAEARVAEAETAWKVAYEADPDTIARREADAAWRKAHPVDPHDTQSVLDQLVRGVADRKTPLSRR